MNKIKKNNFFLSDYYSVFNSMGIKICDVSSIEDVQMMCSFDSTRTYRKQKFIMDQVITITSKTDPQLPGQQGLPPAQEELSPMEIHQNTWLPEGQGLPINTK